MKGVLSEVCTSAQLQGLEDSGFVSAEISVSSNRKLFILIIFDYLKKNLDQSMYINIFFNFEHRSTAQGDCL